LGQFDPPEQLLRGATSVPGGAAELESLAVKPSLRPALLKRRQRRGLRRLNTLKRRLLALLALCGLAFLWLGPFWRWDGLMTVSGNRLVSRQEIFSRLYIPQNRPLYLLNPRTISAQLAALPPVEQVVIQRWLFPPRLDVMIVEREAFVGVVAPAQELMSRWIDREGVVFQAPAARMTPRFLVQVWTELQPGEHIPSPLQKHLLELLSAWPAKQGGRIDLRNPGDILISLGNWPVRIGEPDEASLKLSLLGELIPLAEPYRGRLKYINLRFPLSPTFVLKTGDEVKVEKETDDGQTKGAPTPGSTKPPQLE